MLYKYQWVIATLAGVAFFAVGYIYDIHPLLVQLSELHQSEILLHEKLETLKTLPKDMSVVKPNNQINAVNEFVSFVQSNGLGVKKIKQGMTALHLEMEGGYQQFVTLMNEFNQKSDVINRKNVSCKWNDKNYLEIGMDVSMMGEVKFSQHELLMSQVNPFCTEGKMNAWRSQDDKVESKSFPISQMKMKGYMEFGGRKVALLQLPNKMTIMVEEGDVVGREQVRVIKVNQQGLQVCHPG